MEKQPGASDFPDTLERALDKDKGVALPAADRLRPVTTRAGTARLRLVVTSVAAYPDASQTTPQQIRDPQPGG